MSPPLQYSITIALNTTLIITRGDSRSLPHLVVSPSLDYSRTGMSYTQQQQQAAWVAHLQQQQQARGLAPLTPQQIAHLAAQLHSRQQQQQQQASVQATGQQGQGGPPAGITSHERPTGGDHAPPVPSSAPTDRSLPLLAFKPHGRLGPTDDQLAPSLEALQQLANSYSDLQHLERRLDWTLARKAHQVAEQATTTAGQGLPFKRTLRVHVLATVHDQSWQLEPEHLAAQADPSPSGPTPRVELRISGQLLDVRPPSQRGPERVSANPPPARRTLATPPR